MVDDGLLVVKIAIVVRFIIVETSDSSRLWFIIADELWLVTSRWPSLGTERQRLGCSPVAC